MATNYQIISNFTLTNGKPLWVKSEIFSTKAACTFQPFRPYPEKCLTISYIFPTMQLVHSYIAHLRKMYPHSPAPPPVLDSGQQELFKELST
jgi:hypothetical protein